VRNGASEIFPASERQYRVAQKNGTIFWYAITLPNINRFSKFFHCQSQEKICNNTVAKDPTTPQVCRYTTLWNVDVLKATIENKTTSSLSALTSSKINSEYYCRHVLGGGLLPDIRERCQRYSWTLQQDGAPSHCKEHTDVYIPAAWERHFHRAWHVAPKQSITLFGVPFSRWLNQSIVTSGANCRSVSLIAPLVSGVVDLSASSSSKADTLNIWWPGGCDSYFSQ